MQPDIAIPILPSRSLDDTQSFYRRLGFKCKLWGAPYHYAILDRGTLEIHFFKHESLIPAESFAGCYLRVQHVDELFRVFATANLPRTGIPRMEDLENKPWGMREFAILDPDGNLIRIGQEI